MQTSKASQSPEHRTSSAPAAKPTQSSLPASSSQPSSVLTSRPELPSLLLSAIEARDASQQQHPTKISSPRFKPVVSGISDGKKTEGEDSKAASAIAAGTKRARDGKDGPEAKPSRKDQQDQKKFSAKPHSRTVNTADHDDVESASPHATKRARKGSKSSKSDKLHRPKPADDSTSQTEAHSPRPKIIPTLTLSSSGATPDAEPGSPTSWKHSAQSPRANAANRASITLAPRRNSNAGAIERPAPARQAENPLTDKPVAPDIVLSSSTVPNEDFAFSACDLDTEGVIRVVSGTPEQGKEGQPASAPALPTLPEASVPTQRQSSPPPVRQAVPGQPALAPEMTALMDELEAALEKPINM